jgi:hypothetical protein
MASFTLRRLSALARDDHLPLGAQQLPLLRSEVPLDRVEQRLELGVLAGRARDGQRSWWSTSATDAPKRPWSCAFADFTCFRFPFSEPDSGKWSSTVRMPT